MSASSPVYTSRIQKGGAMISEMRQLVHLWTNTSTDENKAAVIRANPLGKATRSRVVDVLNRIFVPRFVKGPIPCAWKLLRTLEEEGATPAIVRPIYYWVTARSEPLLSDFVTEYLVPRRATGLRSVGLAGHKKPWMVRNCGRKIRPGHSRRPARFRRLVAPLMCKCSWAGPLARPH